MSEKSLTNTFPPATREAWLSRVEGVLKGADFDRKLVGRTYDGIAIQPLYEKASESHPVLRAEAGRWRIGQRMDHPDPLIANELALADLAGGADSLTILTRKAEAARGFGLDLRTLDDLDRALSGIMLDLIHIRLDAGGHGRQVAALFAALARRRGHAPVDLSIDFGLDPLGAMAAGGQLSASWEAVSVRIVDTHASLTELGFSGRIFLADGRPYHEAGASEGQELASSLSTALAYWRALETGGMSLDKARDSLAFLLVADADEFLTVAKFRAMRRLWARVEQAAGLAPKPIRLHAETAWRTTTRRDPWVNMLRATVATFSAGLGGADSITVLPFTAALGLPDGFARRVARNTQLILLEEANLHRVADPASGSGALEALTNELCDVAWGIVQETERNGGMIQDLKTGAIQRRIAETRAKRQKAVDTRRDPITGTSEFPNPSESAVSVLAPSPLWPPAAAPTRRHDPTAAPVIAFESFPALIATASEGANLANLSHSAKGADPIRIEPLPSLRSAEPFERLRDRSDAHLARTGARPRAFLTTIGSPAAFTARATFAKNLFEAGGIEPVVDDHSSDVRADLICLCSSDDIYQQDAVAAVTKLRQGSALPIYLAGKPGALEGGLTEAGVTGFIFAGMDVAAFLDRALTDANA